VEAQNRTAAGSSYQSGNNTATNPKNPMKTIEKGNQVKRVSDKEAHKAVTEKGYHYVPKSVWKKLKTNPYGNPST
jgi:hypothetical protein